MRRSIIPLLSLVLAGGVYVGSGDALAETPEGIRAAANSSAGPAAATVRKLRTPYAFNASGFGTKIDGGSVPVGSGKTAFQRIGCNNLTGVTRRNFVADVAVQGTPFSLSGVETSLRTRAKGRGTAQRFSSIASQEIADLNLLDTPLGSLSITGLSSRAKTTVQRGKYSTSTDVNLLGIAFTPAGGSPQRFPVPTPNNPTVIPGLAEISLGKPVEKTTRSRGLAYASVLKVRTLFTPEPLRLTVANARTSIDRGVENGVYSGFSTGVEASAVDGVIKVGRNPLRRMPCQGTGGDLQQSNLAEVDLADQIVVKAARAEQRSESSRRSASGFERGSVAEIRLGGDALVVKAIVGKAVVTRTGSDISRKARGGVGSVVANGEKLEFPDSDVIEVPGLARLQQQVVKRSRTGISVTGLRIQLLDGTGATIDLGKASLKIGRGSR